MAQKTTILSIPSSNAPPEHLNERKSSRHAGTRSLENHILVWLDPKITETDIEYQNSIAHLRRIVNSITIFNDSNQCVDYLADIKDERVFLIISDTYGQQLVSLIKEIIQLDSIYVLCGQKAKEEPWTKTSYKVKGVFTEVQSIYDVLKHDIRHSDDNLTSIGIMSSSSVTNLNELDQSFMYSQLLKEILFKMEFDDKAKKELVEFFRIEYADNNLQLRVIDEFEHEYNRSLSIWWYTREAFIYSILNRALRTQNIEIILKMGFFIQDLHHQIEQLQINSNNRPLQIVYRGQGLLQPDFEKLSKSKGGLLSFNNFLSTSTNRDVSLIFARSSRENPELTGILFRIEIDTSVPSTPFASLTNVSYYSDSEEEVLFSMHVVFRITNIQKLEDQLWEVNLKLTSDKDEQLNQLTEYMRHETRGSTGLHRLSQLMITMGEYNKAEEINNALVESTSSNDQKQKAAFHHQLGYIALNKGDLSSAFSHCKKSLDIYLTYLKPDDPKLSPAYSNIGVILLREGNLDEALKYFEHALNIEVHATQPNQERIAGIHNNMGLVLKAQGKYPEALSNFKNALKIDLVNLPPRHPSLATTYINIGVIYYSIKDYSNALPYFEKALEIQEKSLPSNHSSLALTHHNMAMAFEELYRYKEAMEHTSKAADIYLAAFGPDHPRVRDNQEYLEELRHKL